jgi:hypothetical protein
MKWIIIALCTPAALLLGAFLVMVIRDRLHPYYPTRDDVRQKLRRVLDGTMTCYEWDDFTHIPLKRAPALERIRTACFELEQQGDLVHRDDPKMEEKWMYNERGLERIRELLKELEDGSEQQGGGYSPPAARSSKPTP